MKVEILSKHRTHRVLRDKIDTNIPAEVRFGWTQPTDNVGQVVINTPEAIRSVANKHLMKTIFRDNDINSPRFYNQDELDDSVKFPLIAKKLFHSKGRGMQFIKNQEELDAFLSEKKKNYYFEEYANYLKEYRIHSSIATPCFWALRKALRTEATERWFRNDSNSVWLLESNKGFDKPSTWNNIIQGCQDALKVLGMDVCSFDVLVSRRGDYLILEANSASSMAMGTTAAYTSEIQKIIDYKLNL